MARAPTGERKPDHGLVTLTTVHLVFYIPVETLVSLPELWDPFYIVDLVGMVLLTWGVLRWRRGASGAIALLVAGWAWSGANFWRAFWDRVEHLSAGEELRFGLPELCVVGCGVLLALVALGWSLRIAARTPSATSQPSSV